MSLKKNLLSFLHGELNIPLAGIAQTNDFSPQEIDRISSVLRSFSRVTTLPEGMEKPVHPQELLGELRSIIVVGVPGYMERPLPFEQCREDLLGSASPQHITAEIIKRRADRNLRICSFFTDRGFTCKPLSGTLLFSAKLMAARCGIGYYGKNSMIQHPEYGSWFSLTGFMTDAVLEPDEPLPDDCGDCRRCVKACPAGALDRPYLCDETRCINFHLGHNKKEIPAAIRTACGNLIGTACSVCRDVCPGNKDLKPISGCYAPKDLLNPPLLKILDLDEEIWKNNFSKTLMGLMMRDKKYLLRNAAIALGNFRDQRALTALSRLLEKGAAEVRGYAAWALGRIGSPEALSHLQAALPYEQDPLIEDEILRANLLRTDVN